MTTRNILPAGSAAIARAGLGYLVQESSLLLLFCFVLFFANTWRALADYGLIRVGVVTLTVVSLIWLGLKVSRRTLQSAPLVIPLTVFLVAYLLTAFTSITPRRSFDEVWVTAMYIFVFVLTAQLVSLGWPRELFVKTLLIAGALLAALAWYIFLNWYFRWLSVAPGVWEPEIAFRLPLANGTATFVYLLMLSAVARFMFTSARVPRLLLALWIISALGLLYLTASRGGWLATAAGLATIAFIGVRDRGGLTYLEALLAKAKQHWKFSLAVVVAGVAVFLVAAQLATRQISNPEKTYASAARVEYWVPAWDVFLKNPIVGQGPLTFGSAYLRYNSTPPHLFFAHAHSLYFNLLSETGLIGFIAFGVLAMAVFVALWRQVNRLTGEDRAVAVAALACAVAWVFHSFVDTIHVEPMNAVLLAVLLGSASAGRETGSRTSEGSTVRAVSVWWPITLGLLLSATGLYNVWRLVPYHEGVLLGVRSQWANAATQFEAAKGRDPGLAMAYQQSGLVNSILTKDGPPGALDEAIADFEKLVILDPDWWLNHANLAGLYLANGDTQRALIEIRAAEKLAPDSSLVQLNYGLIAETAGQATEAKQAYWQLLALRPDWAGTYLWRSSEFRANVLEEWRAATPSLPVLTMTQMQALATGADRARDYTPLITVYLQMGQLDEADLLLRKADLALFDNGEDRMEALWLKAELAAARGDLKSAVAMGEEAVEGYQTQSAFGPGGLGYAPYSWVFYRQESMAVDLVPQLTPALFTDKWAERFVKVGDWYTVLGDEQAAEVAYQQVVRLVPDYGPAAERLGR